MRHSHKVSHCCKEIFEETPPKIACECLTVLCSQILFWNRYNSSCKVECTTLLLPGATKQSNFHLIFLILNYNKQSCILIIKVYLFRNAMKRECNDHTNMNILVLFQMQLYFTLHMNQFSFQFNPHLFMKLVRVLARLQKAPDDSYLLIILPLYIPSYTHRTELSDQQNTVKMTTYGLQHQIIKGITASTLVFWIPLSGESQPPCFVDTQAALKRDVHGEKPLANSQNQQPSHVYGSHWKEVLQFHSSLHSSSSRH